MQFDFLVPIRSVKFVSYFDWSWVWLNVSTFAVLNDKIAQNPERIRQLEAKFPAMIRKHAQYAFNRIGQPYDEFIKKGGKWEFFLQPFQDVHLHSGKLSVFYENTGDIRQVYMFGIVAIFIILLACVNFMNLSTARSLKWAKEVGVRKTLGSFQNSLIKQFLAESLLYSFLATVLALVIISAALPWFNKISGKTIAFNALFDDGFGFFIVLLMLTTGVLAGSYPAFYLTSFKPIEVLKTNSIKTGIAHLLVRNGLVVFQFAVSTALIICTIVVFQQLSFTQNKDLGLTKENVIVIPNAQRLDQSQEAFRQEIARIPDIIHTSISTNVPLSAGFGDFYLPEQHTGDKQIAKDLTLCSFMTDDAFIKTLDIKLTKGRNFSKEFSDSTSVILNEAAVKKIGWKDPVGKYIYLTHRGLQNQFWSFDDLKVCIYQRF
jgi:putative ABC transport system permease protein